MSAPIQEYLTPAEVAAEFHISVKTIQRTMRSIYVYLSPRHPMIRRVDLDAWILAQPKPKSRKKVAGGK